MARRHRGPEHALLSLRAMLHPEWAPFLASIGVEPQPVEVAVANLSVLPLGELERLRVLHDLGKAGRLREMAEPARNLAAGVIDLDRFDENFNDLVELASEPGLSFKEFVSSVNQQGIGSTPLLTVDPEACTDGPTGPGPNQPTRIFASFEASGHPHDFAYGADPLHWPDCNPFFLRMIPGPKQALPAVDNVNGTAYKTRLTEVVGMRCWWKSHQSRRQVFRRPGCGRHGLHIRRRRREDRRRPRIPHRRGPPFQAQLGGGAITEDRALRRAQPFPATLVCESGWIHVMQNMASCAPPN